MEWKGEEGKGRESRKEDNQKKNKSRNDLFPFSPRVGLSPLLFVGKLFCFFFSSGRRFSFFEHGWDVLFCFLGFFTYMHTQGKKGGNGVFWDHAPHRNVAPSSPFAR